MCSLLGGHQTTKQQLSSRTTDNLKKYYVKQANKGHIRLTPVIQTEQ